MGFFSELSKALNDEEAGERYLVAGEEVVCTHCHGKRFFESSALLDSRGMTLMGLDWANKGATILVCAHCGHVEWFAEKGLVEKF